MQSVTIGANQAGQRLDKFLHKYLPLAGSGFLYKMLRKKNITLNGKKAEGREILSVGEAPAAEIPAARPLCPQRRSAWGNTGPLIAGCRESRCCMRTATS